MQAQLHLTPFHLAAIISRYGYFGRLSRDQLARLRAHLGYERQRFRTRFAELVFFYLQPMQHILLHCTLQTGCLHSRLCFPDVGQHRVDFFCHPGEARIGGDHPVGILLQRGQLRCQLATACGFLHFLGKIVKCIGNAFKEIGFFFLCCVPCILRDDRLFQLVVIVARAFIIVPPHPLALVHKPGFLAQLQIRGSVNLVILAYRHSDVIVLCRRRDVQLFDLPRRKPLGQMLGKHARVGCVLKRSDRDDIDGAMMSMRRRLVQESGNDYVRSQLPDFPDQPFIDLLFSPFGKGLVRAFGEAEIVDGIINLFAEDAQRHIGDLGRLLQLPRADDAERIAQLAADLVLSAFAAIGDDAGRVHSLAQRQVRQHCAVLVVGMRACVHGAGNRGQRLDRFPQVDDTAVGMSGLGRQRQDETAGQRDGCSDGKQLGKSPLFQ